MVFSYKDNKGQKVQLYNHYLQQSHVHCRSYNCVSNGLEWLIPYQGMVFKLFLPGTLTKSSNKSMMIDQPSLTTLLMRWHYSTSLCNLYIKDWWLEETTRLCDIFVVLKLCQNFIIIKNLEFLNNFHILEILKSRVWCVLYFTNTSHCISSV
jgi:hypothetical protein